jgi:L-arabinose isomerase
MEAAQVANTMFHNRMGAMGHYYSGMLDIYTDLTLQLATFGGHIEIIEVDELSALRNKVQSSEIKERIKYFHEVFSIQPDCPTKNWREQQEHPLRSTCSCSNTIWVHLPTITKEQGLVRMKIP